MKKSISTRILLIALSLLTALSLVACTFLPAGPTEPADPTDPTDPPYTLLPPQTPNRVTYTRLQPSAIVMRSLTIKAGLGGEKVVISQLSDPHCHHNNWLPASWHSQSCFQLSATVWFQKTQR